jgi:hypothetical protein
VRRARRWQEVCFLKGAQTYFERLGFGGDRNSLTQENTERLLTTMHHLSVFSWYPVPGTYIVPVTVLIRWNRVFEMPQKDTGTGGDGMTQCLNLPRLTSTRLDDCACELCHVYLGCRRASNRSRRTVHTSLFLILQCSTTTKNMARGECSY